MQTQPGHDVVQNSVSWGMTGGWVVGYALKAWGDAIQLLLVDHLIVWWDVVDVVERAGNRYFICVWTHCAVPTWAG